MNLWLAASAGISLTLLPCAFVCFRGSPERRLVGIEMTSLLLTLLLVALTIAFGTQPFIDIALIMAILTFGGGLFYARFMERHP